MKEIILRDGRKFYGEIQESTIATRPFVTIIDGSINPRTIAAD